MTQVNAIVNDDGENGDIMTEEEFQQFKIDLDILLDEESDKEADEYLAAVSGAEMEPDKNDEEFESFIKSVENDLGTTEKEKIHTRR